MLMMMLMMMVTVHIIRCGGGDDGGGGGGFTWARTRVHKGQHRLIFLLGGAVQGDDEDVLAVEGSE